LSTHVTEAGGLGFGFLGTQGSGFHYKPINKAFQLQKPVDKASEHGEFQFDICFPLWPIVRL
jgi:hypothetical protein